MPEKKTGKNVNLSGASWIKTYVEERMNARKW